MDHGVHVRGVHVLLDHTAQLVVVGVAVENHIHDVPGVTRVLRVDLHRRVHEGRRARYIHDSRQAPAQVAVHARGIDRFQRREVLARTAKQAVEQCIAPPGHVVDLHDVVGSLGNVIPQHLAERSLPAPLRRQDSALDDDLGGAGDGKSGARAWIYVHLPARQFRGQRVLIHSGGKVRAGGQKNARRDPDQQRHRQRLPGLLGPALVVGQIVTVAQPQAQFPRARVHRPVKGKIGHARIWIQRQHDCRGEIRPGVALVVGDQRQVGQLPLPKVLRCRRFAGRRLDPGLGRVEHARVGGGERPLFHRNQAPQALPVGKQVGDHFKLRALYVPEQDRSIARLLRPLGHRRQLKPGIDRAFHGQQSAGLGQSVHPRSHHGACSDQRGKKPVISAASAQQPAPTSSMAE